MRKSGLFMLVGIIASCSPFSGPRKVDWKKQWEKNQTNLKLLAKDVIKEGSNKYIIGINDFPKTFTYPFDDGFAIRCRYIKNKQPERIDTKNVTITFYTDRGLLDHYSAIIFTNDSISMLGFDRKVIEGGNDFKLESNWYMIND